MIKESTYSNLDASFIDGDNIAKLLKETLYWDTTIHYFKGTKSMLNDLHINIREKINEMKTISYSATPSKIVLNFMTFVGHGEVNQ